MQQITIDRRVSSRRTGRPGGRRATDQPVTSTTTPVCPDCRQSATVLAGESDGGWWFVCDSCDYLWDQRLVANRPLSEFDLAPGFTTRSKPPSGSWLSTAALSWWKLALGRPG
jgi:hypothetical protein